MEKSGGAALLFRPGILHKCSKVMETKREVEWYVAISPNRIVRPRPPLQALLPEATDSIRRDRTGGCRSERGEL